MKIKKLNIHDAFEFIFPVNKDHRGLFFRTFCKKTLKGFKINFSTVQQSICYNYKKELFVVCTGKLVRIPKEKS